MTTISFRSRDVDVYQQTYSLVASMSREQAVNFFVKPHMLNEDFMSDVDDAVVLVHQRLVDILRMKLEDAKKGILNHDITKLFREFLASRKNPNSKYAMTFIVTPIKKGEVISKNESYMEQYVFLWLNDTLYLENIWTEKGDLYSSMVSSFKNDPQAIGAIWFNETIS